LELFKSRYITILKKNDFVEISHKPKYLQVVSLLIILIGSSILMISVGSGVGLVVQLLFIYTFVSFLLLGLARSFFKYPVVFTGSQLIYKKGLTKEVADYSVLKEINLEAITKKKWKIEVSDANRKIVEVYLFADNQGQREGVIAFKNALNELRVPIK